MKRNERAYFADILHCNHMHYTAVSKVQQYDIYMLGINAVSKNRLVYDSFIINPFKYNKVGI